MSLPRTDAASAASSASASRRSWSAGSSCALSGSGLATRIPPGRASASAACMISAISSALVTEKSTV